MDGGAFGELGRAVHDAAMAIHSIPPLSVFSYGVDSQKSSPLTEDEVWAAFEMVPAIIMKAEDRDRLIELRGPFGHLGPENVRDERQEFRAIQKGDRAND